MEKQYLWIDAADFQDKGGWSLDTQFAHLMGSPYLLACQAPGVPVEDAIYQGMWNGSDRIRVWARTKNWYFPYAPGRFCVSVNGKMLSSELGNAPTHDWYWQEAGDVMTSNGMIQVTLHDLTGYFGRCAAILLTDDMDFVPKRPVNEYIKERAQFKKIDLTPEYFGEYDVVVAGAGPGGVPAAIAAARNGAKTLLISGRPILGGNSSEEAGVGYNGASSRQVNAREGGIAEEIIRKHYQAKESWTKILEGLCRVEKNLTVLYNKFVTDAKSENGVIRSTVLTDVLTNQKSIVQGKIFIDCTGDGWLGYHAGAKFRIGRESKWQYDEDFAPLNGDTQTMSGCIMNGQSASKPLFIETDHEAPYVAPEWVPKFASGKGYGRNIERIGFAWWLEAPNTYDDLYDAEMARDELFRILLGHFNYLKNLWDEKEKASKYIFNCMPFYDAKRESRRFVGDYVLNQNDCMEGKLFPDAVSHAGWCIDLHNPKGIYSGKEGPFFSNTHIPLVTIPFRCLYSVNMDNLLFAGRCASVTHIALGTCRLENTIACEGQAVGTAAAMCVQMGIMPRALGRDHIGELQQRLLRADQYIPGIKNTDQKDLARTAVVTASSEKEGEEYFPHIGMESEGFELNCQRASFFARGIDNHIGSVWTKLTNRCAEEKSVLFHVRLQGDPDGYTTVRDTMQVKIFLPPNSCDWYELKLDIHTDLRYLWIWADKNPGVFWHTFTGAALDHTRSERENKDAPFPNIRFVTHAILLEKPEIRTANCKAENVINGYSRINSAEEYQWVSDPQKTLPQWLALMLQEKTLINCVEVTLDTDMTNPSMLGLYEPYPHTLVKDYDLEVWENGNWTTVDRIRDNWQRKIVHHIKPTETDRIRIFVKDTGDHKTARIFEVRVYRDQEKYYGYFI